MWLSRSARGPRCSCTTAVRGRRYDDRGRPGRGLGRRNCGSSSSSSEANCGRQPVEAPIRRRRPAGRAWLGRHAGDRTKSRARVQGALARSRPPSPRVAGRTPRRRSPGSAPAGPPWRASVNTPGRARQVPVARPRRTAPGQHPMGQAPRAARSSTLRRASSSPARPASGSAGPSPPPASCAWLSVTLVPPISWISAVTRSNVSPKARLECSTSSTSSRPAKARRKASVTTSTALRGMERGDRAEAHPARGAPRRRLGQAGGQVQRDRQAGGRDLHARAAARCPARAGWWPAPGRTGR